jgi:hypothetical protein
MSPAWRTIAASETKRVLRLSMNLSPRPGSAMCVSEMTPILVILQPSDFIETKKPSLSGTA